VFEPDRRVLDRGSDDRPARGVRVAERNRIAVTGGRDRALGSREPGSSDRMRSCGRCAITVSSGRWAGSAFFSLLQKNVLDRQRWANREELRVAIVIWIERTYHRRRRQRALGRLTPIEYEILTTTALAA
jgi:transposase InsO family protein